ncbi:MAG: hypothetical protein WC600_18690 [Desulfobaccales bacterium]
MSAVKIMALLLIVAGIVVLMYGKFSYTKETHDIKLGPLEMSIAEKQTVNVPVWAGVGQYWVVVYSCFMQARKGSSRIISA